MSDLEKINIYVPEQIGVILDNDANPFEILKKDGKTINRNKFLSLLILGYQNSYVSEYQQSYLPVPKFLHMPAIRSLPDTR